jgi:hypothetical protein
MLVVSEVALACWLVEQGFFLTAFIAPGDGSRI